MITNGAINSECQLLFNTMTYGVVFHDRDGKIFMVNPAAEKILGLTEEQLIKDHIDPSWHSIHEDGSDFHRDEHPIRLALSSGEIVENTIMGLLSSQFTGVRWINITAIPVFNDGERLPNCAYALLTDISDRISIYHNLSLLSHQLAEGYQQQLAEKELIIKEVHHRIKNNLNSVEGLLAVQMSSIRNKEAIDSLQLALGRLKSMRMIYEKLLLSNEYSNLSVKAYLEDLIDSYHSILPDDKHIHIERNIEEVDLEVKKLFSIGVIVNELLTDVLKYGFTDRNSGIVKINLSHNHEFGTLIIEDDGVGLPDNFDINHTSGFGLKLVKMLSEQMGGGYSIRSDMGTRNEITFRL